jgi:hypothetical protein
LLHALKAYGAKEIFGIPGDFALPFFRVVEESGILPLYTLSHEPGVGFAADAPAHALLHRGDGVGVDPGRGMEDDPAGGSDVKHTVDDDTVKVRMRIEAGTEAVDEGHRAEARRGALTWAVRAQALLHQSQEQAQSSTLEIGVALQEVTQALGHGQDPLAHRQRRQDVIGQMCRRRHHAPGVA